VNNNTRNNNKYDPGSQDGGADQAGWQEQDRRINAKPCGSELARESGVSGNNDVD
jgi:hypothetical protein